MAPSAPTPWEMALTGSLKNLSHVHIIGNIYLHSGIKQLRCNAIYNSFTKFGYLIRNNFAIFF